MPTGWMRLSLYMITFVTFMSGCSGSGGGSSSGDSNTTGGTSPLLLTSVVYDDNKTAATGDDRLDIYFNMPIDETSLPADISSAFEITGAGAISADSLYSYSGGWTHRLRIAMGNLSTAFEAGVSEIALAQEVIADENFEYPASYAAATVVAPRIVLKTAQTLSYAAGDDGDYQAGTAHNYERNATTGIVTDLSRGLHWLDVNTIADATWTAAAAYCEGETAGNLFDWRLPGIEELAQLSEKNTSAPAIDGIFQNIAVGTGVFYWSDMPLVFNTSIAWSYSFDIFGYDSAEEPKTATQKVLCVEGAKSPDGEFIRNDLNGTVLDTTTGLLWQDNLSSAERSWSSAVSYCEGLDLSGFNDWRMPNYNELYLLAERSTSNPAIDGAFETNYIHSDAADIYWSSTSESATTTTAFGISFNSGDAVRNFKTDATTHYVRCVRNTP